MTDYKLPEDFVVAVPQTEEEHALLIELFGLCGAIETSSKWPLPSRYGYQGLRLSTVGVNRSLWTIKDPTYTVEEFCFMFAPEWADKVVKATDSGVYCWFDQMDMRGRRMGDEEDYPFMDDCFSYETIITRSSTHQPSREALIETAEPMTTTEKLLSMHTAVYGKMGGACWIEVKVCEETMEPIGVRVMKHGDEISFESKADLLFEYITLDWKHSNEYIEEIKRLNSEVEELKVDANRYRFLRDEDNWGGDDGNDCWEELGQSHGNAFDAIVDSRIAKGAAEFGDNDEI